MKKKRTKYPINMTQYQPVVDIAPGGYLDLTTNLGNVLKSLALRKRLGLKTQKVRVRVSKVGFYSYDKNHDDPFRYEDEKIYTIAQLLNLYELSKGIPFNVHAFNESQYLERRSLEIRGEGRAAWGMFIHTQEITKKTTTQ
jgi:hypothetical protein